MEEKLDDHLTMGYQNILGSVRSQGENQIGYLDSSSPSHYIFFLRKQQCVRVKKTGRSDSILLGPISEVKPFSVRGLHYPSSNAD